LQVGVLIFTNFQASCPRTLQVAVLIFTSRFPLVLLQCLRECQE
jgi:hypothetical protein